MAPFTQVYDPDRGANLLIEPSHPRREKKINLGTAPREAVGECNEGPLGAAPQ